jgi:hypothetical protein
MRIIGVDSIADKISVKIQNSKFKKNNLKKITKKITRSVNKHKKEMFFTQLTLSQ